MAKKPQKQAVKKAPKQIHVAVIDADGLYQGVEAVAPADAAGRVPAPPDCDLTPGAYRWDDEQRAFVPLGAALGPVDGVNIEAQGFEAVAALMLELEAAGTALPAVCGDWLAAFDKSIDRMGKAPLRALYGKGGGA